MAFSRTRRFSSTSLASLTSLLCRWQQNVLYFLDNLAYPRHEVDSVERQAKFSFVTTEIGINYVQLRIMRESSFEVFVLLFLRLW